MVYGEVERALLGGLSDPGMSFGVYCGFIDRKNLGQCGRKVLLLVKDGVVNRWPREPKAGVLGLLDEFISIRERQSPRFRRCVDYSVLGGSSVLSLGWLISVIGDEGRAKVVWGKIVDSCVYKDGAIIS